MDDHDHAQWDHPHIGNIVGLAANGFAAYAAASAIQQAQAQQIAQQEAQAAAQAQIASAMQVQMNSRMTLIGEIKALLNAAITVAPAAVADLSQAEQLLDQLSQLG